MQLRDAQTSELIAEGTPEEIAIAAQAFDAADILFDDVGAVDNHGKSVFKPVEVRKRNADDLQSLETELANVPEDDEPRRLRLREAVRERKQRAAVGKALQTPAADRMQAARARVKP